MIRNGLSIVALALALAVASPTSAQTRTEFTDQQIASFVVAALAVDELIRAWIPRIRGATVGKLAPPPWGRDQKLAAVAAWKVMPS